MPSLNANLAWAVPVDIMALGPNFAAHIGLQPTITTLRLCHRFGRSDAPISRLPVELVSSIEEMLMEAEREKQREVWHEYYQCYRGRCSPRDHYSEDELNEIRGEVAQLCDRECDSDGDFDDRLEECECIEEGLDEYLINYKNWDNEEYETHHNRSDSWRLKVEDLSQRTPLLTQLFGVSLWTSTVRLSGNSAFDDYYPEEMTIAYLMLATNTPSVESSMNHSQNEYDLGEAGTVETGCAMDVTEHQSRPKNAEHRFKRAMRILDLKLHDPHDQADEAARLGEAPHDAESNTQHPKMSWPRLTVLMRTKA